MAEERIWTAALLVIGDEILSGRTQDKNVAQVATWLNLQGIRLAEVRIVPDKLETIAETVNALRRGHDYLFTTGGIGHQLEDDVVQLLRGHAWNDVRHERVQYLGGEAAGGAHAGKALRPVELDHPGALGRRDIVALDRLIFGHDADIGKGASLGDPAALRLRAAHGGRADLDGGAADRR